MGKAKQGASEAGKRHPEAGGILSEESSPALRGLDTKNRGNEIRIIYLDVAAPTPAFPIESPSVVPRWKGGGMKVSDQKNNKPTIM